MRPSRRRPSRLLGEGERGLTGDVVGHVDAPDPATPRVASGQRLEMEPRLGAGMPDRLEATAAFGTRHRGEPAVADR